LTQPGLPSFHAAMTRWHTAVFVGALALYLVAAGRLGRLEAGGPPHMDVLLEGGIPATLYLPGPEAELPWILEPPPVGERPPGLVLAHGFASDRGIVSVLARRLARNGVAVLTPDLRGHGANANPFPGGRGRRDELQDDLDAAVRYLRASPFADHTRIAVAGHSMGATAALEYASHDSGLAAVVPISGALPPTGPHPPPDALFVVAERDPERLRAVTRRVAARLAEREAVEPGVTYGEPAPGDAVRWVSVDGTNHATVIWAEETAREVLAWLDTSFGLERGAPPDLRAPRLVWAAVAALAVLVLLPGVGAVAGRLAPPRAAPAAGGAGLGLALLAASQLAAMPLVAAGRPARFLGLFVADTLLWLTATGGLALLALLALRRRLPRAALGAPARSLAAAGLALAALYALVAPLGVVVHALAPIPARLPAAAGATLLAFPLLLATELLVRRGPPVRAALAGAAARVLLLLVWALGVALGTVPGVLAFVLPPFAVVFVAAELVSAPLYARSRDRLAIAAFQSAWTGLVLAVTFPLTG